MNYSRADNDKLLNDKRFNHRQRTLLYANKSHISSEPSKEELRRIYAILFHAKDIKGLERFCGRFDLNALYEDPMADLPQFSKTEVKQYFKNIWKMVRYVNPKLKKPKVKENPMAKYPYPGRKAYRKRMPGSPNLTEYFIETDDGTVYFLKRSYLEDQMKKWLLSFARKHNIFVTAPRMIKGTAYDISLDGLILQIMSNADHETYLIDEMQKRQRKLYPEDAEALYSGEYIIIDK